MKKIILIYFQEKNTFKIYLAAQYTKHINSFDANLNHENYIPHPNSPNCFLLRNALK
jgi:hypothetical protein